MGFKPLPDQCLTKEFSNFLTCSFSTIAINNKPSKDIKSKNLSHTVHKITVSPAHKTEVNPLLVDLYKYQNFKTREKEEMH